MAFINDSITNKRRKTFETPAIQNDTNVITDNFEEEEEKILDMVVSY